MADSLLAAFLCPFRGLRLTLRAGLLPYAALPLLVNVILFSAAGALLFSQAGAWLDQLLPAGGWHDYLRWLLWPLLAAAFLLLSFFTFTTAGNLIAAPFADRLAEKTLATLDPAFRPLPVPFWPAIGRSLGDGLRKAWHLLSRAVPALLLFLVPGVNVLAPAVWLAVASWLLAVEYLEYPAGAAGVGFDEQRRRMRRRPLRTLAFGAGVAALTVTPVLNLAAIPASVAGACLFWRSGRRPEG